MKPICRAQVVTARMSLLLAVIAGCTTVPSVTNQGDRAAWRDPAGPRARRGPGESDDARHADRGVSRRDLAIPGQRADAAGCDQGLTGSVLRGRCGANPERSRRITVVLNGSSSVNPVMSEYYANATATVSRWEHLHPAAGNVLGERHRQPAELFPGGDRGRLRGSIPADR